MGTKQKRKPSITDRLLDARVELRAARAALAQRDDTTNRDRLTLSRDRVDALLDEAYEADMR